MAEANRHWSKASEAGSLFGMKILLFVYQVFGRSGFRVILYPVITYYYLTRKEARLASKEYIQNIKPFIQDTNKKLSSFQHFIVFGELLLDKFLAWMGKIDRDDVVFETVELLEMINNGHAKKGGIILVSHLGNSDVCNALAYQLPNIRLTVLVYTQHAEKYNSLIKKSDISRIEILQVTDISPVTAMLLSERVDDGEYIVISGDRTPPDGRGRVSEVTFLNKQALMPQGAFIIASLLNCPIYLMFCLKHKTKYHIYVELFKKQLNFNRQQRNREINQVVQDYTRRLESYCFKAPLQWFNFFPFWLRSDQKIRDE